MIPCQTIEKKLKVLKFALLFLAAMSSSRSDIVTKTVRPSVKIHSLMFLECCLDTLININKSNDMIDLVTKEGFNNNSENIYQGKLTLYLHFLLCRVDVNKYKVTNFTHSWQYLWT